MLKITPQNGILGKTTVIFLLLLIALEFLFNIENVKFCFLDIER